MIYNKIIIGSEDTFSVIRSNKLNIRKINLKRLFFILKSLNFNENKGNSTTNKIDIIIVIEIKK